MTPLCISKSTHIAAWLFSMLLKSKLSSQSPCRPSSGSSPTPYASGPRALKGLIVLALALFRLVVQDLILAELLVDLDDGVAGRSAARRRRSTRSSASPCPRSPGPLSRSLVAVVRSSSQRCTDAGRSTAL
eukprot:16313304-Heterocapsa_arctica.AAC.1